MYFELPDKTIINLSTLHYVYINDKEKLRITFNFGKEHSRSFLCKSDEEVKDILTQIKTILKI